MNHQEAALRRSACSAALRTVLEESVVAEVLWELEEHFRCAEAEGFTGQPDVHAADFQRLLKDLGRNYLLDERALKRLSDEMTRAFRRDADHLPEDPWIEMQAQKGIRPVRQPQRTEKEQHWYVMPIHTFQVLWHLSWHGRVLHKIRKYLHDLDQWLLRRMEENYGRSG
jgi:hypothetical protein